MPRLPLAGLDSVVSPRKRYCILCVLIPELREALMTVPNPSISSFQRAVPSSLVTFNVAISFLFNNLFRIR
jgi:hypothetical protein